MNLLLKGSFAILALAATLSASAQTLLDATVSGSSTVNGGAYSGGTLSNFDLLSLLADGGPSGVTLSPNNGAFDDRRSMVRFSAHGGADFSLPSDRAGHTVPGLDGDSVVMSSWNPDYFPQTPSPHVFRASVDSDPGDGSTLDVEVRDAPDPKYAKTGGSFLSTLLDGSVYDQDPTAGHVLIDRDLTPTLTIDYTLPEFTFTREVITWNDGSTTASPNRDEVHSGVWFSFDGVGGRIFTSVDHSSRQFAPNEGLAQRVVASASGSFAVDMSLVANGTYSLRHSAVPWHMGGYDNVLGGGAGGDFTDDVFENVQVVPEPASLAALGLGAAALLRRRRRS